jgi:ubiquinone/menaquinone biosynthesis C-methylase UbiE
MSTSVVIPPGWAPGETWKAKERRLKTGWFEKYVAPPGIDIGCQNDPLYEGFRLWDVIFGDGDATFMEGVEDELYQTTYCSHVLEHLEEPVTAIKNWYRITKSGGNLIVLVPHRDLYERKESPPSNWNQEHKWFFIPENIPSMPYHVTSLRQCILDAIPDPDIISYEVLSEGFVEAPPHVHASGEYSIEAIIRKR